MEVIQEEIGEERGDDNGDRSGEPLHDVVCIFDNSCYSETPKCLSCGEGETANNVKDGKECQNCSG